MRNIIDARERAEEFDAVVTYLNAVSEGLSSAERHNVAGALHELVLRRKGASAFLTCFADDDDDDHAAALRL